MRLQKIDKPPEKNLNGNEMTSSQQWRLNPNRSWTNTRHLRLKITLTQKRGELKCFLS